MYTNTVWRPRADIMYVDVLDKGRVWTGLGNRYGSEEAIYAAARISRGQVALPSEVLMEDGRTKRLFKALLGHTPQHASPFEFAGFSVIVKAPIFVARQLHRHRFTSIMEYSLRYNDCDLQYYEPEAVPNLYSEEMERQRETYKQLLNVMPKEQARGVLGTAFYTYWHLYANLREWMHIISLRTDKAAQAETRKYAEAFDAMFEWHFPNVYWAWKETNAGNDSSRG